MERTESENNSDFEPPKSSSEEEGSSRNGDNHSKRMTELEKRLEAIANRSNLQEAGIIQPYTAEWDAALYPLKFKAPTLHTFNDKGSPNQHIYYSKSQTQNVVSNDAIMIFFLFIGTLKLVAFEWFMKLPARSIMTWADLEKLFVARFYEDTEISLPTLLVTKQKKGESIKIFVKRFWSMALQCPSGMTQTTLVETSS